MSTSSFGSAFSTGSGGSSSAESLSYAQVQTLNATQRLRAARNAGSLVTLSYELVPQDSGMLDVSVVLPRLPRPFIADEISLTTYDCNIAGYDALLLSLSLSAQSGETIVNDPSLISEGTCIFTPWTPLIPARQLLNCSTSFSNTAIYGSYAYGLVLWIRGVWAD